MKRKSFLKNISIEALGYYVVVFGEAPAGAAGTAR